MALDFELTDEQKMIVETVKKFKEKECPKEKVREWDKAETFPSEVWKKLGEVGLLGAAFPEASARDPTRLRDPTAAGACRAFRVSWACPRRKLSWLPPRRHHYHRVCWC